MLPTNSFSVVEGGGDLMPRLCPDRESNGIYLNKHGNFIDSDVYRD
jgi:hypothetical protein